MPESLPTVYEVKQVCTTIENAIRNTPELQNIWIKGEISSFSRNASSGHIYFTLLDTSPDGGKPTPAIKCTYFRGAQTPLDFELKDGVAVEVFGTVTIYAPSSVYNFNVRKIRRVGLGDLLLRLQQIRERLLRDGLIKTDETRRTLPLLPRRVGIITGAGTAAYRDILRQAVERYPNVEIVLAPAQVQGENAVASVIAALTELQKERWGCDVIIVARGGGSVEELLPFSDESLCRAIANCRIPIVSAIGHQIDHPISDEVADYAAATPTDAGRRVFPVVAELKNQVDQISRRAYNAIAAALQEAQLRFVRLAEREFWDKPYLLFQEKVQWLDNLESKLHYTFRYHLEAKSNLIARLKPLSILFERALANLRSRYELVAGKLEAYSPMATLRRGYSLVYAQGKIISDPKAVKSGDPLTIRMAGGTLDAEVL
ncbi:MAG: exodeoxyribonuclease VII large subunit [Turneriella sp.]|nr:exodeoxyribonuclease VII large subunit [Turneriella sp.]